MADDDDFLTARDVELLRDHALLTVSEVRAWLPGPVWHIGWKSRAAAEVKNSEGGPSGPWGERPILTAYAGAAVMLDAATTSLVAIASVVSTDCTVLVPGILARAAVEAGSVVSWVTDPEVTARERVVRFTLVRASSARNLAKAVKGIDRDLNVADYGETMEQVRIYAASLGLGDIDYVKHERTFGCEGVRLPTYTKRAADFLRDVSPGAYGLYSGMAHAELYAVKQSWRQALVAPGEEPRLVPHPGRKALYSAVATATLATALPAFDALSLLGLDATQRRATKLFESVHRLGDQIGIPRSRWTT